ncbi:MAG: 3-hydroxyacyl-CoA dehydrogenase/enoyl-CoA hydratase family protein [Gammaproteobacteria bacterium]|nr:3-hydroxyacyl-CoA dehydrogenase/enoyl-CoA hydratase family protein [Gammaproteobacteria bacterium]
MNKLYPTAVNPLLVHTTRPLPKEIGIIGAGTIGPDIAYYLKSEMPTIKLYLIDISEKALQKAEQRLVAYTEKAVAKRKMNADLAKQVLENLFYTTDYSQLENCDLVIEAATESIPLKKKIFESIEQIVSEQTLITSNTSSIPADRLFCDMKNPSRATVTHFFAPAWRSLTVEIVDWELASRETLDYLFWFFGETGKAPIMTENAICFVLDRIFDNWCNEAAYLLDDATAAQIDCVTEEFVHAGPFFVLNMANGNPIIVETNTLQMEEGKHYLPANILNSVDRWDTGHPGLKVDVSHELRTKIRDRLLGILLSQSFDIIDRSIGTSADLNSGCQVVLGFKEGPLDIMRSLGEEEVNRIIEKLEVERPGFPKMLKSFNEYQNFRRYILTDDIDDVKIITVRRPQAMNALNDEINDEILAILEEYANDDSVKGFVITGYGKKAFSAGADIGKFPDLLGDSDASIAFSKDCAKLQCYIDQMTKPVIAALNGMALGGGLEVAIRCHSLVAIKGVNIQLPEITLGILPGIGGCVVPYRRWPKGAELFHQMITLGKPMSAEEAKSIGMVAGIAETFPELITIAIAEIDKHLGKTPSVLDGPVILPPFADLSNPMAGKLALSKEAVNVTMNTIKEGATASNLSTALEIGYKGFGSIACTEAAKEGISSFLEKRKPVFTR